MFNPSYVDLHYGKVTYPIYGYFEGMVVHPPLQYKIIGTLMRWGFSYYYAEGTPTLLMSLVAVVLIILGPFRAPVKIGLLCGLASVIAVFGNSNTELFGMRPEGHLNAVWMAGLIALESGRLLKWNLKWLGAGAFLVSYASGLHYYAAPAILGIVVYMAWVVIQVGWRGSMKPLIALAGGALAFVIPYFLLFVIPEWRDMVAYLGSYPHLGMREILASHFAEYEALAHRGAGGIWLRFPLTAKIPLMLLSVPILAAVPATRGVALASIPLQGFILLFASHKHEYYFVHEISIYSMALAAGAAVLADRLLRLPRREWIGRAAMTLGAAILGAGLIHAKWSGEHSALLPVPRVQEAEVARAAGKAMLGADGRIGSQMWSWYASGGAHWYNVSWDLLGQPLPAKFDVAGYASGFDAIAESGYSSNVTSNGRNETLSSWYASGVLHLRGFFFAEMNTELSYVLLRGEPWPQISGFAVKGDQMYKFQEHRDGDYRLVSMVCPVSATQPYRFGSFSELMFLANRGAPPVRAVVTALEGKLSPELIAMTRRDCTVFGEFAGFLVPVNRKEMVEKMRREDEPMHFYRHFTDVPIRPKEVPKPSVPIIFQP